MEPKTIPKQTIHKIGRNFALLFNRVVMYDLNHPFTKQSSADFLTHLRKGYGFCSPLVLMMNQGRFFIEDEALDPRLNTDRMLTHFKKTGTQSISFSKGLDAAALHGFLAIFTNPSRFTNVESMTAALSQQGIRHVRLNHVTYRKVTADEEVVDRRSPEEDADPTAKSSDPSARQASRALARQVLATELETTLSVQQLLQSPKEVSKALLASELSGTDDPGSQDRNPGKQLIQSLQQIRADVDSSASTSKPEQLEQLAEAAFHFRRNMLVGLQTNRTNGIQYPAEDDIRKETDELTRTTVVQLVKEEYRQGDRTLRRFAAFLTRLMPQPDEIRQLLPHIRDALIAEGMSIDEYRLLTRELDQALQNDELGRLLAQSVAEMGVDGRELLNDTRLDPKGAAELIYLAAEIRKKTGDPDLLSDLLVDYIEQIGTRIALDQPGENKAEDGNHLRQVISGVESELVNRLRCKDIDPDVLDTVARRLNTRIEESLENLQKQLTLQTKRFSDTGSEEPTTVFNILEESVTEGNELDGILKQVRRKYENRGLDENNYDLITREISRAIEKQNRPSLDDSRPRGILNRRSTLYILEKEIARSIRYGSPFSVLMISIIKVTPEKQLPPGSLKRGDINLAILEEVIGQVRSTDIIGLLDKRNMVVLMPMTIESESKTAMRRILKLLQNSDLSAGPGKVKVRLAGTITTFDHQRTPTLEKFVQLAETEIFDMVNRLRNIQALY